MKKILLPVLVLAATVLCNTVSAHNATSDKGPIAYGNDQTIIDLEKLIFEPLKVDGLPSGAEIAMLRGSLDTGAGEIVLRLPPGYKVPSHSHTSDEVYVWLKGAFTLTLHDGKKVNFSGPAFISFPGNAPPHALDCGSKEHCLLYLRYSRPFDILYQNK